MTVTCCLVTEDTVKDKSGSIRFLVLFDCWGDTYMELPIYMTSSQWPHAYRPTEHQ